MAGEEGFEPPSMVLETIALPLNYSPLFLEHYYFTIMPQYCQLLINTFYFATSEALVSRITFTLI